MTNPIVNKVIIDCQSIKEALNHEGVSSGRPIPNPTNPANLNIDTPVEKKPPESISSACNPELLKVALTEYPVSVSPPRENNKLMIA